MKKEGPILIGFLTGSIVITSYFLKSTGLKSIADTVVRWRLIIAAFALALGALNMVRLHGKNIHHKGRNWQYSVVFLVFFLPYLAVGLTRGSNSPQYQYIWKYLYQPASATMYSMTLFYMTNAVWRAFRIRNLHAGILMFTGAAVMLGQIGIGAAISPLIPRFSSWLLDTVNTAGIRAITIGGSLGIVSLGLRVILGLERSYMSDGGN
ncbi:MAG TPA: hypothetical protein GXX30_09085 [Firmicutes bacterium]|nr:hypothetical protein [Candidatus Fermentithermobacillaceae bacterium]